MDERDRIALLTYNTSVKQHFGLQEATAENKQIFQNVISSIIADGRTNLCDCLTKGKYAPLLLIWDLSLSNNNGNKLGKIV